jgi:hypothetical protein
VTNEEYWQSYLSKINSITLRQQVLLNTPSILDLLSRFNPNFPTHLDVGPGWIHLIAQLNTDISYIDPHYKIAQVKEKFGGLRYYVDLSIHQGQDTARHIIEVLINHAESQSFSICENCGQLGKLTNSSWRKTLCDSCAL